MNFPYGMSQEEWNALVLRAYDKVITERLSELKEPIKFRINLSEKAPPVRERRQTVKRPSRNELQALVREAQSVIIFDGGRPGAAPPKRQHIDRLSHSFGLLWGIACAFDCSLTDVIVRFGDTRKLPKHSRVSRASADASVSR